MTLGIDASNIRAGGGLRHLVEFVSHVNIDVSSFEKVIVWSSSRTLAQLADKSWLVKNSNSYLDGSLLKRIYWQKVLMSKEVSQQCDILFLPSGNTSTFHPYVSMCQNLLPFDFSERKRYGFSVMRARLELLSINQKRSFRKSDGTIFLSDFSRQKVVATNCKMNSTVIIPHGVTNQFRASVKNLKEGSRINLLYVSIIDVYKHQWEVVNAVFNLLDKGYDVQLDLVGPAYGPAFQLLSKALQARPELKSSVNILGPLEHSDLAKYYSEADIFVFASSCETFGMIVLEAMASGLPIACSDRSSMPEVLESAGIYFDPEDPSEIEKAIISYIETPDLRQEKSQQAKARAEQFEWKQTARQTLDYLSQIARTYMN